VNGRSETRAAVRDWTLQAALLVLLVLTHELLRAPHVRLHFVTVPLLAIPVAYFSTVLGARGAALSAILTGVLLAMHRNDWHAEVIALEIGLLASISFLGAGPPPPTPTTITSTSGTCSTISSPTVPCPAMMSGSSKPDPG